MVKLAPNLEKSITNFRRHANVQKFFFVLIYCLLNSYTIIDNVFTSSVPRGVLGGLSTPLFQHHIVKFHNFIAINYIKLL